MKSKSPSFKIGDSVKVRPGILDPDTEAFSIEGWQGRVNHITTSDAGQVTVYIEWDSLTLRVMPEQSIELAEEEGLDWTQMGLYPEDIELTIERDTLTDVQEELQKFHYNNFKWLGEEGRRINKILAGVDFDDNMKVFERWGEYLEQHLSFPFEAVVDEWQERGALREGDDVIVKKSALIDGLYGLIVKVRLERKKKLLGRKNFDFPLCDLAALDEQSSNFQYIDNYRTWFANR